jgi:hypothetical protein
MVGLVPARLLLPLGVALALLLPLAGGALAADRPSAQPWAHFDTGRVSVVFPSALPEVLLSPDANSSGVALLQIDAILEIAPGNLPHPTVVAAAAPTAVAGFNGTPGSRLDNGPLTLTASLNVARSLAPLWEGGASLPVLGPRVGTATLVVSYELAPAQPTTSGLTVHWSILGWPWMAAGDLLAVQMHFSLAGGSAVAACTSGSPGTTGPVACGGDALGATGIVWDSSISSLEGESPTGPAAAVAWPSAAQLADGNTAGYSVGALASSPGAAELVLAAPADQTSQLSGAVDFSLLTLPAAVAAPALLHGSAFPYVATIAIAGLVAVVGILAYRRRDRIVRERL